MQLEVCKLWRPGLEQVEHRWAEPCALDEHLTRPVPEIVQRGKIVLYRLAQGQGQGAPTNRLLEQIPEFAMAEEWLRLLVDPPEKPRSGGWLERMTAAGTDSCSWAGSCASCLDPSTIDPEVTAWKV